MADEKILPEGVRFFNKHENAPDFVVGSLVITADDLFAFMKSRPELTTMYNGKKQIRLQVLRSQAGALYSTVDTYKPGEAKPKKEAAKPAPKATVITQTEPDDDLPF